MLLTDAAGRVGNEIGAQNRSLAGFACAVGPSTEALECSVDIVEHPG